jgi:hypothetical protein
MPPSPRNINAKRLHNYYEIYPEDFNKLFYNSKNRDELDAAEKDTITIPYNELVKLQKISDFFSTMYDEGVPEGESHVLHRSTLTVKPVVFKWIPAVLNLYDVHVENPSNLHYNPRNALKLPVVQDYVRGIIILLGLPLLDDVIRPPPMPRNSKRRTVSRRNRNYNSNSNSSKSGKSKATRRRTIKHAETQNIRGLHPLEEKYM